VLTDINMCRWNFRVDEKTEFWKKNDSTSNFLRKSVLWLIDPGKTKNYLRNCQKSSQLALKSKNKKIRLIRIADNLV
jgi:hypothetical protein